MRTVVAVLCLVLAVVVCFPAHAALQPFADGIRHAQPDHEQKQRGDEIPTGEAEPLGVARRSPDAGRGAMGRAERERASAKKELRGKTSFVRTPRPVPLSYLNLLHPQPNTRARPVKGMVLL